MFIPSLVQRIVVQLRNGQIRVKGRTPHAEQVPIETFAVARLVHHVVVPIHRLSQLRHLVDVLNSSRDISKNVREMLLLNGMGHLNIPLRRSAETCAPIRGRLCCTSATSPCDRCSSYASAPSRRWTQICVRRINERLWNI